MVKGSAVLVADHFRTPTFNIEAALVPGELLNDYTAWRDFARMSDVMFWEEVELHIPSEIERMFVLDLHPVLLYKRVTGD